MSAVRPFSRSILEARGRGLSAVIADIKPVSPRDGDLLRQRSPADLARSLEHAGACALSVVTEPEHFGGSVAMLRQVAEASRLPVLRKDFFVGTDQVVESRDAGARAVLLTLATIPDPLAGELYAKAWELGLEAVVEVHTEAELERALRLDPTIVGVNNRDLLRLEKDDGSVSVTERLAPLVPGHVLTISESSLLCCDDVRRAFAAGADAVLVGTAVLQAGNVAARLRELTASSAPLLQSGPAGTTGETEPCCATGPAAAEPET